ncbi:MAG: phosphoglycerate kinase [Candidatus Niyogibacteria bacterium]|nr:phosphoglycerate kinase [Candidatus Niyogibacteria bacterium]
MKSVNSVLKNVRGRRVLLRVDLNLPMENGKVKDQFRLLKTLPAIKALKRSGAIVILASHLEVSGRNPSLRPVLKILRKHLGEVGFAGRIDREAVKKTKGLRPGGVLLLENLRRDPGEEKNSSSFSKKLSALGDLYVNEAFSASHRKHASIVGVPKRLPSFAGPLFLNELAMLKRAMNPSRPFLFILGGNKLSTKISLIEKFFKKADFIVVGGLMMLPMFPFWGWGTGRTSYEKARFSFAEKLSRSSKVFKPRDLIVSGPKGRRKVLSGQVLADEKICDFGPESLKDVGARIKKSKFVFWNGPMGYLEGGFEEGTETLARSLARSRARVFVGGGDTAGFLQRKRLGKNFYFISTGGGASLDFLAKGTLPGIEALEKSRG